MNIRFDPFDPLRSAGPASRTALEDHLLFTIFVCNKPARRTRQVLNDFYEGSADGETPLGYVGRLAQGGVLDERLRACQCGQYTRIGKALMQLVESGLDVTTCTLEDLEAIHGIGQKSSRFFMMYGRGRRDVAVLDTHVLRWLRKRGVRGVPRSTPTSVKTYLALEQTFLKLCRDAGLDAQRLDFDVWLAGAFRGPAERRAHG